MTIGQPEFETERLRLEPVQESHATELFELFSDRRMYLFVPQEPPPTLAHLAARFRRLETRRSPDGTEEWLNWAVRAKSERTCLGCIQVTIRPDRRAQFAYEIGVPYWRRGFATEACRRVIRALFDEGIIEVWAEVDTRNMASIRLLERLGFRRGVLRHNADHFKGSDSSEWTYALAADNRVGRIPAKEN